MPLSDKRPELDKDREKLYKDWIDLAEAKHAPMVKRAKRFMDRLKQNFPAATDDENQSVYNYYVSNMKRLIPELFPKEITVKVKPAGGKDEIADDSGAVFDNRRAAIILDNKVNEIFKKQAVKYSQEASIYDLLISNLGCLVVGQETELVEKDEVPEGTKNLLAEKQRNGEAIPGETAATERTIKGVKKKELIIKRESYRNVMVDPDSSDFFYADKRYVVRIVRLPKDEAEERFGKDALPKDVGYDVDEEIDGDKGLKGREAAKKIKIYELYDYTGDQVKRVSFLGKGIKFLGETSFNHDPINLCQLNYLPDVTYPPCDMVYYESQVDEGNFYSTVQMNAIDRGSARKVIVAEDALDSDNQDKLESNKDMEIVTVKTKGLPLPNVAQIWESSRANPDTAIGRNQIMQNIQEISGVNSLRLGQVAASAPATNATIANQSFLNANEAKIQIIKDWLGHVAENTVEVLKELAIETESFYLEYPNGEKEKIEWKSEDIAEADVEIEIDFRASLPDDVKMKRMMEWVNWISQPAIATGLAADKKKVQTFNLIKETASYFMPDVNFDRVIVDEPGLIDPADEVLRILAGNLVDPLSHEDFKKHLAQHEMALQHPAFINDPEALQGLQQHIERTKALMQGQETLKKMQTAGTGMPGQVAGEVQNVQA